MKRAGHKKFCQLLKEMEDLHNRENSNYAQDKDPLSNLKMSKEIDIPSHIGCFIRIQDKYARVRELLKGKPDRVGESIKDTMMDLAVYSLLFIILYEENK